MCAVNDVRLFFALWPDPEIRHQIAQNLTRFDIGEAPARRVSNANLHLTLHFIGNTTNAEMACFDAQASKIKARAFELRIDSYGLFNKPKVLWLGCDQIPSALIDLQRELGEQISHCAFEPERRPFAPHITVARKVTSVPETIIIEPLLWRVNDFVLVKSCATPGGVEYQVAQRFKLHQ